MLRQSSNRRGHQRHGSLTLRGLWSLEQQAGAGLLKVLLHGQFAGLEVDILPAEAEELAAPHASADGEERRQVEPRAFECAQQLGIARLVEHPNGLTSSARRPHSISRVHRQHLPPHSLAKRLTQYAVMMDHRLRGEAEAHSLRLPTQRLAVIDGDESSRRDRVGNTGCDRRGGRHVPAPA